MGNTFFDLRDGIRDAIRAEVATIPDFDCGAIVLSFVVKSELANRLLGNPCDKDEENTDVDFAYSAKPNRPKTRPNGFRGMTDGEVACRGYAALKIEGCCYAVRNGLGRRSSDMPDDAVTWGRANDRGAVCFDIEGKLCPLRCANEFLLMRIYVAVSGVDSMEDERCALAAAPVIKKWATDVNLHDYDPRPLVLRVIEPEPEEVE